MEIRTPVLTLKGSRPRPLDDGGRASVPDEETHRSGRILSFVRRPVKKNGQTWRDQAMCCSDFRTARRLERQFDDFDATPIA